MTLYTIVLLLVHIEWPSTYSKYLTNSRSSSTSQKPDPETRCIDISLVYCVHLLSLRTLSQNPILWCIYTLCSVHLFSRLDSFLENQRCSASQFIKNNQYTQAVHHGPHPLHTLPRIGIRWTPFYWCTTKHSYGKPNIHHIPKAFPQTKNILWAVYTVANYTVKNSCIWMIIHPLLLGKKKYYFQFRQLK